MTNSKLKLNPSKTEFIIIGSKKQREKFKIYSLYYYLTMTQTCKICFYHIRDFRRIREYLSPEATKSVACALVTSHLDYCKSLLYNLPDRDIERLQRVQNCLARVIYKAFRFSRSKPLFNFLHWLPVKYRRRFKLCTTIFQAFLFHQPTYLFNYLVPLKNSKVLRSSKTNMLTFPRFRTKWGSRAFAVAAPSTWNSLPVNLRTASTVTSFQKTLKTFHFNSAPPPPNSSEIRRPVDDLRFDSRHWAGFDLDSAPLSSHLRGFKRNGSYRIELNLNWIESNWIELFNWAL